MTLLALHEAFESCPYCGEQISLIVDLSEPVQQYIEDCEVCCRPITVILQCHNEEQFTVTLQSEDEVG